MIPADFTAFLGKPVLGTLRIPDGVTEIPDRAFWQDESIRKVILPASVRKIGARAFSRCKNLKSVSFSEGLKSIGRDAFSSCPELVDFVLPDSVHTFESSDIPIEVYNRSRTELYKVPGKGYRVFRVPHGVKRIMPHAFERVLLMEEVVLPETLEEISPFAFWACYLPKVVIPQSVRRVEPRAFGCCDSLKEITVLGTDTRLAPECFVGCPFQTIHGREDLSFEKLLGLFGLSTAQVKKMEPPKKARPNAPKLLLLAEKCSRGDSGAMMQLGDYFEALGEEEFYRLAAHAWRYRAYKLGNREGRAWMEGWRAAHPMEQLPVLFPTPLRGSFHEGALRHAGFLFFDADSDEESDITAPDQNGVVTISKLTDEDGPDEDGFGREDYFSYWYVDEHLRSLPGVRPLYNYSNRDRRNCEADFKARYAQAVEAIRKQKGKK